ncbi:3363_t:CDS:2 [Funneliformis caledonium]|uniref:3363_t:CDS:1 n=1 Tax=Funneliformis caledonium TaxID=1117310 RepID=A0A9N9B3I0_9GLOM|nr:3363_t:CDS:2 [Funneliformis caledonium]
MVYTPKLVSQNNSSLFEQDVNSSPSCQSSESRFNSSTQWLRRRFEQSQEISSASEFGDQYSPLLLRGKSGKNLNLGARSTGFQPFSPVQEQSSPTSTSPASPTFPQLQGLIREQSRTSYQSQFQSRPTIFQSSQFQSRPTPFQSSQIQPSQFQPRQTSSFQSNQFQLRPRIDTTGSTLSSIQGIAQQDNTSRLTSFASTPQPLLQSQPSTYITQSNVAPINTPTYTGPVRTSDSTFDVGILGNRFEGQPIYSSGQNIIEREISNMNVRIADSPLVQSTPAPKPRQQQTSPPHKLENLPYLARLLIIEQELPKNDFEVEKSNSVKTLICNICLVIVITILTSTKYFRQFEIYTVTNFIGKKKKQINQIKEQLMKELEQNSSYDPSCYTISPPRPSKSITTPTSSSTVVSSIPTQFTILPSSMSLPFTGISTTSTIFPSASASSSNSFINAWGSSGRTPFPQQIPPTTKYRQAPYVTPSKIDEKLITVGNVLARSSPTPHPTDRET